MHALKNIHVVPYHEDLPAVISQDILERCSGLLPDLHTVTVFLPGTRAFQPLREKLVYHAGGEGHESLIPPVCTTLCEWALAHRPPDKPLLSQYARELILVDAIKQHPAGLFSAANPWVIANELLSLFDAMRCNGVTPDRLQNQIDGYQSDVSRLLSREAEMVIALRSAWQQQLSYEDRLDPIDAYAQATRKATPTEHNVYYAAGLDRLAECERLLLEKIDDHATLHVFFYASGARLSSRADLAIKSLVPGQTDTNPLTEETTSPPYAAFLDEAFVEDERDIKQRAEEFCGKHSTSPVEQHLKIYKSNSFEQHAKAIDVKIRSHLHRNKKNIGIVTTDRKLARRLRALLEHANVPINDPGGWALATTSSAVIIELWLQLVEKDYAAKPLLALLRSPFFPLSIAQKEHDEAVNILEKDLILARGLKDGLDRYQSAIQQFRDNRKGAQHCNYLLDLLRRLETATANLAELYRGKPAPLHHFLQVLLDGLKAFGIYAVLKKDEAGIQMIELLETQIAQLEKIENAMEWPECRRFLARILDQQDYKPPSSPAAKVTLCNLERSRLLRFDALIIASVDKDHFPGNPDNHVFFNERVRSELNIPTRLDEHAVYLHLFRRLLNAAPDILITFQNECDDEKNTPSPWLQIIETFHRMAYGKDLSDTELQRLVACPGSRVTHPQQPIPMPSPSSRPAPVVTQALKPDRISVSQYQALINCPYQFFARACLKLYKTDELKEVLGKDDFGSLVHKCIEAFFEDKSSTPGPFTQKVTADTRQAAEDMLVTISKHVFDQHPESGFSKQLWLQRWLTLIPDFIDWEIQRQESYIPHKHEITLEGSITPSASIRGRVDRIDRSDTDYAIIDYKTGSTPTIKTITAGEQIQLPAYALLHENCKQVEYVNIGKNNTVKTEATLKEEQLESLVQEHRRRLTQFFDSLKNDNPGFTALAEDDVCDRCEARGLCRKDYW